MRPRRMPFEPAWQRGARKPVTPSILPLVLLLAVAVAMMVALREEAARLRRQEAGMASGLMQQVDAGSSESEAHGGRSEELVIDLSLLATYQDHAREITPEPFLYLVKLLRDVRVQRLEQLAVKRFTYRALFEDPERFRGRVLTFRGRVRRIVPVPPGPGSGEPYFEAWVFTADSGHLPYCVISVRRPAALPVARRLNEYCRVVGVFLGWWKHETADGRLLSSPIVVTPQLLPAPSPVAEQQDVQRLEGVVGAVLAVLILAGLAVVYWVSRRASGPETVPGARADAGGVDFGAEDERSERQGGAKQADASPQEDSAP